VLVQSLEREVFDFSGEDSVMDSGSGASGNLQVPPPSNSTGLEASHRLEGLTEALLKCSRKPVKAFFRRDDFPRRGKLQRRTSKEATQSPVNLAVPTCTPELCFVSRVTSVRSSTSTVICIRTPISPESEISVIETWTTIPNSEGEQAKTIEKTTHNEAIRENVNELERGTDTSGFEEISVHLKRWGQTLLQELSEPLRRHKVRQSKRIASMPDPPTSSQVTSILAPLQLANPEVLKSAFSRPGSSREFEHLKLEGGTGPPPYLSKRTLDELDALEMKELCLQQELSLLRREKQRVLERGQKGDYKERVQKKRRKNFTVDVGQADNQECASEKSQKLKQESPLKVIWTRTKSSKALRTLIDAI
jgi:hypothetical protein